MYKAIPIMEFHRRIGTLSLYKCLHLGLKPCIGCGAFQPDRLQELQDFCRLNPSYHIYSRLPDGTAINHVVPTAILYCLGSGDDDPSLAGVDYVDPVEYFEFDAAVNELEARMRRKKLL